ncbi:MAG TPA: TMEM175 family protein [Ktedonobacterales bacterium]|nr:TMEM175 family protein [Ktedonobacterales bacterium]
MFRRMNRPATEPDAAAQRDGDGKRLSGRTAHPLLRDTGRVEAFSDGVFAIAVTLLVLNLKVPAASGDLAGKLLDGWRDYVAYVISFAFILIMWVNHHNMFRVIRGTDHLFLLLNGLLLLFVTLVPFTTGLLPHYTNPRDETTAAVIYSGNYFVLAIAFNVLWWYASHRGRLLTADHDPAAIQAITRRYRFGPLLYLLCTALAFLSVPASLALNVLLAIFFAWPHPVRAPADATRS